MVLEVLIEVPGVTWHTPLFAVEQKSTHTLLLYPRLGNSTAMLPMTSVALAGAYLLSAPVELAPRNHDFRGVG